MSYEEGRFRDECERYHDLVRQYEQNIEVTHPESVTSRGVHSMPAYFTRSNWAATNVRYYEHQP